MNPKFLFVMILDNTIRSTENRNPFLTMTEIHYSFYKESFGTAYLAKLCISKEKAFQEVSDLQIESVVILWTFRSAACKC